MIAETPWRKNIGTGFAEKLGKHFDSLFVEDMDTIGGCRYAALELFMEIERQHGHAWARGIFATWGEPPTTTQMNRFKDYAILNEYDRNETQAGRQQTCPQNCRQEPDSSKGGALGRHRYDCSKKTNCSTDC